MRQYTAETIGYINIFEKITKARIKDCYSNKYLTFIVEQGEAGKAIGKQGKNIKKIANLLKKKIRVIEFNRNVEKFVANLIAPISSNIYKEGNMVVIQAKSPSDKASLLGKEKRNFKNLQSIVKKYFDVEIKVL